MRDQTKVFLLAVMTVILIGCGCYTVSRASEKIQREGLKTVKAEATAQIAEAITVRSQEDRGMESDGLRADAFDLKHLAIVEERTEAQTDDDVAEAVGELQEAERAGSNDPAEPAPDSGAGIEAEIPSVESAGGDADISVSGGGTEGYRESEEEVIYYDMEEPRGVDGGDAEEYGAEESGGGDWPSDAGTVEDNGSADVNEPEPDIDLGESEDGEWSADFGDAAEGDQAYQMVLEDDGSGMGSVPEEGIGETDTEVLGEPEDQVEDSGEQWEYLGQWTVSFYCDCSICAGQWSGSPTASGAWPSAWWTAATGDLPFGTVVYVDGYGYFEIQDRGTDYGWIDIFLGDHQLCLDYGLDYRDVWIVR